MKVNFLSYINFLFLIALLLTHTQFTSGMTSISVDESKKIGEILSLDGSNYTDPFDENGKLPMVIIGDGKLSQIWEIVPSYVVMPFGSLGTISSVYDYQFIYFKIEFEITYNWVAIQWDSDNSSDPENFKEGTMEPMAEGDDMWIFGLSPETGVYGDAKSMGQTSPFVEFDNSNNLFWEKYIVNDTDGNPVSAVIEVGRSLSTQDPEGNDIVFSSDYNVSMYFASNVNHRPDNSIAQAKFVLSGQSVGGNFTAPQALTGDGEVLNKVSTYFFYNLSSSLFISGLMFGIILYFSVKKISKEVVK